MICENCRFWEFPTRALYQELQVKGYCCSELPIKETYPDDKCDKFENTDRSPEFNKIMGVIRRKIKADKFGDIMNNKDIAIDDAIRKAEEALAKLKADKEHQDLVDLATKKVDLPQKGDQYNVSYKNPMRLTAKTQNAAGDVYEYLFVSDSGRMVVVKDSECDTNPI